MVLDRLSHCPQTNLPLLSLRIADRMVGKSSKKSSMLVSSDSILGKGDASGWCLRTSAARRTYRSLKDPLRIARCTIRTSSFVAGYDESSPAVEFRSTLVATSEADHISGPMFTYRFRFATSNMLLISRRVFPLLPQLGHNAACQQALITCTTKYPQTTLVLSHIFIRMIADSVEEVISTLNF